MGYRVRHKGVPNGMTYEDLNGKLRIVLYDGTGSSVARGAARRVAYDSTNNRLCAKALGSDASQQQVVIAAEPCAANKKGEYYVKGSGITLTVSDSTYTADDGLAIAAGSIVDTGSAFVGGDSEFAAVETGGDTTTSVTVTLFEKEVSVDRKFLGSSTSNYLQWDASANELIGVNTLTSQTTENNCIDVTLTSDSTYISGSDVSYSQGYGSAAIKASGVFSGATGGCHGIVSIVDWDVACASSSSGVVGIKSIVRSSDVSPTDGYFYGGQFIARKDGSGLMGKSVACIGLEAWFYETGTGEIGTAMGGNFGYHCDSSDAAHETGSVHRGVQIFCDNSGTSDAEETTALCLWNMAGTQDNAINVTQSGSGFTNFVYFASATAPVAANTHSIDGHALQHIITCKVGSDTGYIPVFADVPS